MGVIVEFFSVPDNAIAPADMTLFVRGNIPSSARQVTSISVNSLAVEALFTSLEQTILAQLISDASVPITAVLILRQDLPGLRRLAARLRARHAQSEVLRAFASVVEEAEVAAAWQKRALLIVAN